MLPKPRMPQVLPLSSMPFENSFFGHFPARISSEPRCRKRLTANMCAMASSATEAAEAPGVLSTGIPFSFANAVSMLSTPTPPRAMTFSFVPASITSRVTFVAERTMMAS